MAQSRPADEIVVVDDSSSDQTAQIAGRYCRVVSEENHHGAGAARNRGAREAFGNVYAFIDSDCVAPSDWLHNVEQALCEGDAGAVAGGYAGYLNTSFIGRFAFWELRDRRRQFSSNVRTAVSNNFAARSDLFWRAGGFPVCFRGATLEDMLLSYRIAQLSTIRWLEQNGILHQFPDKLAAYCRQQFAFGRDTVAAYAMVPGLALVKTHQGRKIYFETALVGLSLAASLLVHPLSFAAACLAIPLLNASMLRLCFTKEGFRFAAKAASFLPIRDLLWCGSVLWGILSLLSKRQLEPEPMDKAQAAHSAVSAIRK